MRTFLGVALVLFSGVLTLLTGRKQEAAARRPQTRQIVRWSGLRLVNQPAPQPTLVVNSDMRGKAIS